MVKVYEYVVRRLTGLYVLTAKNIQKRFDKQVVLKGVDLEVLKGEVLGLIGPNGAGKTTLLNILTGTVVQDAGRIFLEGVDITRKKPHERFKLGIGRTFQNVKPFHTLTVEDNIKVAAWTRVGNTEADRKVAETMEMLALTPYSNKMVYETSLLVRKKTELCKAVVGGAKIILLDEPFAGLVEEEINDIMQKIRVLQDRGLTFVIVEHVISALMKIANRVFVLHLGAKLAEGKPSEIVSNSEVLRVYLGDEFELA